MRGVELPEGSITFQIKFSSVYKKLEGTGQEVDVTNTYTPLIWSADTNEEWDDTKNTDGRDNQGRTNYAQDGAPFNTWNTGHPSWKQKEVCCYNGGNWKFEPDANDPTILNVTVSDYEIDMTQLPNRDALNYDYDKVVYYDPNVIGSQYWNIQKGCFSSGEFWILQPFQRENDGTLISVRKEHGSGEFSLTVTDVNMKAASQTQQQAQMQMNSEDDKIVFPIEVRRKGLVSNYIFYINGDGEEPVWDAPLSTGCLWNNGDWANQGQNIRIEGAVFMDRAEEENRGVAYDTLIKFDDQFFEPSNIVTQIETVNNIKFKVFYAAKPDGKGWNHRGREPNEEEYDLEMRESNADDLLYYESLDALKADKKTCVGALLEARGIAKTSVNHLNYYLEGKIRSDCKPGYVYMATTAYRIWTAKDVSSQVAADKEKLVEELTDADYDTWVKESFPTLSDHSQESKTYDTDYPAASYVFQYDTSNELQNAQKASYGEGTWHYGTGAGTYIDCCLVVQYVASITKRTAQTDSDNESKESYNMDEGQRVVDYVLHPTIKCSGSGETLQPVPEVVIEDTLPKDLTYITGTSYWKGEYTQVPDCNAAGKVTGGEKKDPEIIYNEDGTTTLRWTLNHVEVKGGSDVAPGDIHFSCRIGKEGRPEDVKNGQVINNTVTIRCTNDLRECKLEYNNMFQYGITIQKTSAVSLVKQAEQSVVDRGEPMGFLMSIGNNGGNSIDDAVIVDTLPFHNDAAGSNFTGNLRVTDFSVNIQQAGTETGMLSQFKSYLGKTDDNPANEFLREEDDVSTHWHENADGELEVSGLTATDNNMSNDAVNAYLYYDVAAYKDFTLEVEVYNPHIDQNGIRGGAWIGFHGDPQKTWKQQGVMFAIGETRVGKVLGCYETKAESYGRKNGTYGWWPEEADWSKQDWQKLRLEVKNKTINFYVDVNGRWVSAWNDGYFTYGEWYQGGKIFLAAANNGTKFRNFKITGTPMAGASVTEQFDFYYTTDTKYKGVRSNELKNTDFTGSEWKKLTVTDQYEAKNQGYHCMGLPENLKDGEQITAIVAKGNLGAGQVLKTHVTLELPEGKPGDSVVNYLSLENLMSSSKSSVASRILEGLVWLDTNFDGIQNDGIPSSQEQGLLSRVKVSLWKLKGSGNPKVEDDYEPYHYQGNSDNPVVEIEMGQQVSVQAESGSFVMDYKDDSGNIQSDRYKFADLPAGTYAVKFTDNTGNTNISQLLASPVDQGDDDTVDSDGIPIYSEDHSCLERTVIFEIEMPEAKDMSVILYESKYNDSGFYEKGVELPQTGGTGTLPYTFSGVAIMGGTLLYYISKKQGKRKEKEGRKL